jgi:cytochrome c2
MRLQLLAAGCAALLVHGAALAAPPAVAGFDRFHGKGEDPAKGGRILLTELNCVRCHAMPDVPATGAKSGPDLSQVGSRVRVSWLKKYLADPQAVKPGTTMPHLLGGADSAEKVDLLVHYLATTGKPKHSAIDAKAGSQGKAHYENLGCASCHGKLDAKGKQGPLPPGGVPLPDLAAKYSLNALSAFLANPHEIRPGGRMPTLLTGNQPREVANYLLGEQKIPGVGGALPIRFDYYEGEWDKLPDFSKLTSAKSGTCKGLDLGVATRKNNFAMRFTGVFQAEKPGRYTFTVASDDGSAIWVDGQKVVAVDGVHPKQSASGQVQLSAGIHTVEVQYFQGGGEWELEAEVRGGGMGSLALETVMAESEAAWKAARETKDPNDPDALEVNDAKLFKGRQLFANLGCANCHRMNEGGKDVVSQLAAHLAKPVGELKAGGCLAEKPADWLPNYSLSPIQKKALETALASPKGPSDAEGRIRETMVTLNCLACHQRGKEGGPIEEFNALFKTTQPEMGDEARVPPLLYLTGAKLRVPYLEKILAQGAKDRPYMLTRMPGFGAAAKHLVADLKEADKLPAVPMVLEKEQPAKLKSVGRMLSGAMAFGCIKCHTFNGNRAEGVQGIDMTLMTTRLERDWFHAYVDRPQEIRPGTRMPTAFRDGKSILDDVLDGTARQQIEAMWVYLLDGTKARPPLGLQKQSMVLTASSEPVIYRNFIEGAGARGIGVGYPEKVNLAFDANELRLALVWQDQFMDAAKHWTDRGVGFEGPLGDAVVALAKGPGVARLKDANEAWPNKAPREAGWKFDGYRLDDKGRPVFLYSQGETKVEDSFIPLGDSRKGFSRILKVQAPVGAYLRVVSGKLEKKGADTFELDGLKIKSAGLLERGEGDKKELLLPLKEGANTVEYAW